ncbi:phenylacetic acid degradation operon negative regulatory protein [Alcaligenes sp. HPC1271]|nr:phenylacetic acid degradation operon negative regulatory protein [Alcaligenes sp. HPC1271]EKU30428.1 phenylacetic acid degradation operon negative regulatory protein [Alcaligenes sp. HPC1271]
MSELPYSDLAQWAAHHLENRPPRAKSLVMTLFGDVIRPHGGKLWLGSLIQLLAPFGISDRLVRTSVYRLAEEGWLSAQREGRRSQYTLRPEASQRFEHAYQRIYTPTYLAWDGQWTLIFSMPSLMMNSKQRADLRKELLWEGFCACHPPLSCIPTRITRFWITSCRRHRRSRRCMWASWNLPNCRKPALCPN